MTPGLETDRLRLRMFRHEDIEEYAPICADPEVMRYLTGQTMNRFEAWRHMAMIVGHWTLRGFGIWAVEEKATGRLVGRVGFHYPDQWPGFELAWTLGRDYWGRGFATEAAKVALEYAFNEMDREHVISLIHPENAPSIRVAERLGETLEGKTQVMGHDVLIYGISRPAAESA